MIFFYIESLKLRCPFQWLTFWMTIIAKWTIVVVVVVVVFFTLLLSDTPQFQTVLSQDPHQSWSYSMVRRFVWE